MLSEAPDRTLRMTTLAGHTTRQPRPPLPRGAAPRGPRPAGALPCPQDRRVTNARLTEAGWQKIRESAPGHLTAVRDNVIDALTPDGSPAGLRPGPHRRRVPGRDGPPGGKRFGRRPAASRCRRRASPAGRCAQRRVGLPTRTLHRVLHDEPRVDTIRSLGSERLQLTVHDGYTGRHSISDPAMGRRGSVRQAVRSGASGTHTAPDHMGEAISAKTTPASCGQILVLRIARSAVSPNQGGDLRK